MTSTERLAIAFRDLESPVYDIKDMSTLLETLIETEFGRGESDADGFVKLLLSKDQFDCLHFAVLHIGNMISDLHRAYYSGFGKGEASDG